MVKKFISKQISNEIPNPLINFIWYLWETYCSSSNESIFILVPCSKGQRVTILHTEISTVQDFGTAITATIVVRKSGDNYYMSLKQ